MRYAIFSDIHGNLQAWKAIHQDMVALEADVLVCLGDVVGYGPLPEEVLKAIRKVTQNFVLGNHDAAAAGLLKASLFNPNARTAIEWTRHQLSRRSLEFLRRVPLKLEGNDLLFVHAEITKPERFGYIEDSKDAWENFASNHHFATFIGHTHHAAIFDLDPSVESKEHAYRLPDEDCQLDPDHRYIINVGSVGEPRNPDDIRARYVIYDSETREVFFRRIRFDVEAYRHDLASSTLDAQPYFLQVVDHHAALEAEAYRAMTIDMQMPMASSHYVDQFYHGAAAQQLSIPADIDIDSKPKPVPVADPNGLRRNYVLALSMVFLLVVAIGYVALESWGKGSRRGKSRGGEERRADSEETSGTPGSSLTEGPQADERKPGPPPEKPDPKVALAGAKNPDAASTDPASTEPGLPSLVERADPEASSTIPDPKVDPSPTTQADPEPRLLPVTEVLAHWRMDKDSEGAILVDARGAHPLSSISPSRLMNGLAPDPLPLTREPNGGAMALGAWSEASPSGEFNFSAARSFTFEGWIMTDKSKKPIFIGGTQPGEGPGWRLDILAAKAERSSGSMRFFYSGNEQPISVLTTEIDLYHPEPHHFAVVWNHDGGAEPDSGRLSLIYDGQEMTTSEIAHSRIEDEAKRAFQLGAASNPSRAVIDEVRFTRAALDRAGLLNLGLRTDHLGILAFMIDAGPITSLYSGADSPAHAERLLPKSMTTWILASHETAQWTGTRFVKQASGETYHLPLTIDIGITNLAEARLGIDWSEHSVDEEAIMEKADGLYASNLMDRIHDGKGERALGLRVRGLEKGRYTLFFTPFVGAGTRSEIVFAMGVDLESDPGEVRSVESPGMQKRVYSARKAAPNDRQWTEGRNFFQHEVEITGPEDYVVVIVDGGESSSIPYLQIVKKDGSALPRNTPIEFRFEEGRLSSQAAHPHPALVGISEMRFSGFSKEAAKIEPRGAGEDGSVLAGTLENPGVDLKDYFHFTFEIAEGGARLDGFSMEVMGPGKLFRMVSLHDRNGKQLLDLIDRSQAPGSLQREGAGTLAGREALGFALAAGIYELRISGTETDGAKKLTIDNVKVDFSRK